MASHLPDSDRDPASGLLAVLARRAAARALRAFRRRQAAGARAMTARAWADSEDVARVSITVTLIILQIITLGLCPWKDAICLGRCTVGEPVG